MTVGHGPCRVLIVGAADDPHVEAVTVLLPAGGTVVVDAESLPQVVREVRPDRTVLRDLSGADAVLAPGSACRGWIRRFAPAGWDDGATLGGHTAAVLAARLGLLGALLRDPAVAWLAPVDRLVAAENKIVQYRAAAEQGIDVPATAVGPDPAVLARALGEPFVAKPLGPGSYADADGAQRVVYARAVSAADLAGADMLAAPFLAQALVRACVHLRVVTVDGQAWVAAVDAAGLPVDWRADEAAHRAFEAAGDAEAAAGAARLAAALGVGFTSQDWIRDEDGRLWFVDLNPGGQWLFLPRDVADGVSQALASWVGGIA